jgi:hypothetical protein
VEIDLFQDGGQIKIKMNVDHHMGAKIQAFDIFQTPLSFHYPLPLSDINVVLCYFLSQYHAEEWGMIRMMRRDK